MEQPTSLSPAMFHILLALAQEERHGYAIMKEVREQGIPLGPGTLYGNLKRMLESGWVVESGERPDPQLDDERRRYYRLTNQGRKVLVAEAERLERAVKLVRSRRVLGGSA